MQPDLIFRMGGGAFVLLPSDVMNVIGSFTTGRQADTEAGGILIGSYRGAHVQIRDCTVPLPHDVRKTHLFDRRDKGHHLAAHSAWKNSAGTETYVGEWHTHPEDVPSPSSIDLRTWNAIIRKHQPLPVIFLIAGRKSVWVGVGQADAVRRIQKLTEGVRVPA